jgi:hypothetical protein
MPVPKHVGEPPNDTASSFQPASNLTRIVYHIDDALAFRTSDAPLPTFIAAAGCG